MAIIQNQNRKGRFGWAALALAAIVVVLVTVPFVVMQQKHSQNKNQNQNQAAVSIPASSTSASEPTGTGTGNVGRDNNNYNEQQASEKQGSATTMSPTDEASIPATAEASQQGTDTDALADAAEEITVVLNAGETYDFTTDNGIPYYHCTFAGQGPDETDNADNSDSLVPPPRHIVLLHGASFDRDVWMRNGIFDDLCDRRNIRVSALELPVSADFATLQTTLEQIHRQTTGSSTNANGGSNKVVLVTPSASGWAMVSAMVSDNANGEWDAVPNYIEVWVPVSPVALTSASDDQIAGTLFGGDAKNIPVLAVYGSEDTGYKGKELSERIETVGSDAGGTVRVVELDGGHAVYNTRPRRFVRAILSFLSSLPT